MLRLPRHGPLVVENVSIDYPLGSGRVAIFSAMLAIDDLIVHLANTQFP